MNEDDAGNESLMDQAQTQENGFWKATCCYLSPRIKKDW
jgi:hypothetical protein